MGPIDTGYVIVAAGGYELAKLKGPFFAEGAPETVPPVPLHVSKVSYRRQPMDLLRRAAAVGRGLPLSAHAGVQVLCTVPLTPGEASPSRREMFAPRTSLRRMTVTALGRCLQHGSAAGREESSQVRSDQSDGSHHRQMVRRDQIPTEW